MTIVGSTALLKVTGLVDSFKTEEIVSSLIAVEKEPVERMKDERLLEEDQESSLRSVQSSIEDLATSTSGLGLLTLFTTSQGAASSEASRVSATVTGGAAIGGYEVGVTQLATAAQRTFTYASPAAAETLSIEGHEVEVAAGESLAELASAINSDSEATVFAAAVGGETLVLSGRETGQRASFIEVGSPGGSLTEEAGLAREGRNAEYTIDGVAGTSASNTVAGAIAGVTLTLGAVTTAGPVTIDVSAPGVDTARVVEQAQAFITQYNSTIAKLETEVSTKPATTLVERADSGAGTLFGNVELEGLMGSMRTAVDTPVEGLPAAMSSLESIGVSTGAVSTGTFSASSVEGKLTLETAKLEEALKTDPEGVRKMLEGWTKSFQKTLETFSGPGGTLASQLQSQESQVSFVGTQITLLTETVELRQKNLEETYTALEVSLQKLSSQSSSITRQFEELDDSRRSSAL